MALAQTHEWVFYEVMWRAHARGLAYPRPWWVQQYFRRWVDPFDGGLFDAKETAFSSNAAYRYWNMVGVKDHEQESLVGQAGEVEPTYDEYALTFFLFDPATRDCHFPQFAAAPASSLRQEMARGYLPVIDTTYNAIGFSVRERVLATTLGLRQRSVVLQRFRVRLDGAAAARGWLCLAVSPVGPTGFQRRDRAGRYRDDRRISFLRYLPGDQLVEVNATWGPLFGTAPASFGVYGNPGTSPDPDRYLTDNPYHDLATGGALNGSASATDYVAGLCTAVFAWPVALDAGTPEFELEVKLPVDDYRGPADLAELRGGDPATLEAANETYWVNKLDGSGLQPALPPRVAHLGDLYRLCRANLLILADGGAIHPGPTIYDSFWIRDSSVEAIACASAGDDGLAESQLGDHHLRAYNFGSERIGPCSAAGFFGGEHEKNDQEWDSNGEALWAFGRFDRFRGPAAAFGAGLFSPYVIGAARWVRDNRDGYGLLHSGWSAEHIGDKGKPHYWDDFWALAGLWEAARLAERLAAPEASELWGIYDDLRRATVDSIRSVLSEQRRQGHWETFIPTGPGDAGRLDSTMIGTLAYFHPCRLYMGQKLGADVDAAARQTLETIWSHFAAGGGFRHDSAWHAYGPYLTLQLAHCFLLLGDIDRMDRCLGWAVGNAAYARVSRGVAAGDAWQVVQGAWNEQHCYPVATDFAEVPQDWWYMGDIPHGWAAAEFLLLLRDILFFEADEDGDAHVYLAPGVPPHWVAAGQAIGVTNAPTVFGGPFGYALTHRQAAGEVEIRITQPPPRPVKFVYRCRFGSVVTAEADGNAVAVSGDTVWLPSGTAVATVRYA